jgi:hypothetical protein
VGVMYQKGVHMIKIVEKTNARKYANLQHQQQQTVNVGCRGRRENTGSFFVQDKVVALLPEEPFGFGQHVCEEKETA